VIREWPVISRLCGVTQDRFSRRRRLRCLCAPVSRARWRMARLHGRCRLVAVVGYDARTAVPGRDTRADSAQQPSNHGRTVRRRGQCLARRDAAALVADQRFGVRAPRIVRTIFIRAASASQLLRARTRAAWLRTSRLRLQLRRVPVDDRATEPMTGQVAQRGLLLPCRAVASDPAGEPQVATAPYLASEHQGYEPGSKAARNVHGSTVRCELSHPIECAAVDERNLDAFV
jgi:hypothetical protein